VRQHRQKLVLATVRLSQGRFDLLDFVDVNQQPFYF